MSSDLYRAGTGKPSWSAGSIDAYFSKRALHSLSLTSTYASNAVFVPNSLSSYDSIGPMTRSMSLSRISIQAKSLGWYSFVSRAAARISR